MAEEAGTRILVIDDDEVMLRAVTAVLKREGYEVIAAADPVEGLYAAKDPTIQLVVTDLRMPNLSGLEVLKALKAEAPDREVILMTAHAEVETALEAVRQGAYDYLTKPFERIEDFALKVKRALEKRALGMKARSLEAAADAKEDFNGMLGQAAGMRAVYKLVEAAGASSATVLVQGESGTGKELVARALHAVSARRSRPFVAVNCSALTETLLESELFGHVKGSFTGAVGNKKGLFEAAHGGTLFLDEIGDVTPATQVRLLRVLQEGEVRPVGGTQDVKVDVRVVAATNVDLEEAMKAGRFREDLYYRLAVVPIQLPPLRDRPEDVPLLAQHFLQVANKRHHKAVRGFTQAAMERLVLHRWPGNVRELAHAVERAVVLASAELLDEADLPPNLRGPARPATAEVSTFTHLPFAQAKALVVSAFERSYLSALLRQSGGNVSQAALAAGMDRSNFRRLLKDHGLGGGGDKEAASA